MKRVGLLFGWFFNKLIWPPCSQTGASTEMKEFDNSEANCRILFQSQIRKVWTEPFFRASIESNVIKLCARKIHVASARSTFVRIFFVLITPKTLCGWTAVDSCLKILIGCWILFDEKTWKNEFRITLKCWNNAFYM
jgi:hypothetical protein